MQENRVSIQIPSGELQQVLDAITTINTVLAPYLVALAPEERKHLPKMSDGTMPFVQKSLDFAKTNAQFVPAYLDISELEIDMDATEALLQVQRPLNQLVQTLDDTVLLCGSEAYVAALAFYNNVKQAARMKVPGAEVVSNDLAVRFFGQGKKK
ncbi:hypothetical protein WSM22_26250 [Cytophagales bacterium WSM2-2]|nr:hypothetical protein WSM22_26250 [Cytophagales bacterium WSM2-2]